MLADNEFWATVINSSANWVIAGAMVVQTIIFFITFKFGFQYLNQHRGKVKIEKNVELAEKILFSLNQMTALIESYFEKTDTYSINEYIKEKSPLGVPSQFTKLYAKLSILNSNLELKGDEVNTLYSKISVWVEFLKDNKARVLLLRIKLSHGKIVDDLYFNQMKIYEEDNLSLEKLDDESKREYIKSKKKEFELLVPRSFYDHDFEAFINYRDNVSKLRNRLIKKHVP